MKKGFRSFYGNQFKKKEGNFPQFLQPRLTKKTEQQILSELENRDSLTYKVRVLEKEDFVHNPNNLYRGFIKTGFRFRKHLDKDIAEFQTTKVNNNMN